MDMKQGAKHSIDCHYNQASFSDDFTARRCQLLNSAVFAIFYLAFALLISISEA